LRTAAPRNDDATRRQATGAKPCEVRFSEPVGSGKRGLSPGTGRRD
jgi:hypothetical protein